MTDSKNEQILANSLHRCLDKDEFLKDFYRRFLGSSPEIEQLFEKTDLAAQQDMMAESLLSMISASDENWLNDQYLSGLAKKHNQLGIKPEHFELWEMSLLASVERFDEQFDELTRKAWQQVIQRGKNFMLHPSK